MIVRHEPTDQQLGSPLGRANPLAKLAVGIGWLAGLVTTTDAGPPLALATVAVLAGLTIGRVPPATFARGAAPLVVAALSIGLFNTVFAAPNADPAASEVARLGPLRVTEAAIAGGAGLASRIMAIALIGVVFAATTDSTRLVDALVQQARAPERFAYGALAAYQAVPRLAEDLTTLREARRIRGLAGSWHPRVLIGLLVLAVRHADRLALAMDARGFGSGQRSRYRLARWQRVDAALVVAAAVILVATLVLL